MDHIIVIILLIHSTFAESNSNREVSNSPSYANVKMIANSTCNGGITFIVSTSIFYEGYRVDSLNVVIESDENEESDDVQFYPKLDSNGISQFCIARELVKYTNLYLNYGVDPCGGAAAFLKATNLDKLREDQVQKFEVVFLDEE